MSWVRRRLEEVRRPAGRVAFALLLVGIACAHGPSGPASAGLVDPPRQGRPLVLVAMPDLESYRTVRHSLINELQSQFDLRTYVVDRDASPEDFARAIEQAAPACVVLMNNPVVNLYRGYQAHLAPSATPVPAVVVMASFLEELRGDLKNATGVAFEVPGVSAFLSLRSVLAAPVRRVGVIHRPAFQAFVERQVALAATEQITLVAATVPDEPDSADVRSAVDRLRGSHVDALWVLNDNRLVVDPELRDVMAELGTPIIVGVPALLPSVANFGTLAVLPDLDGLGVQTANLIVDLGDHGWKTRTHPVELPLSTLTLVNMTHMRGRFGLKPGALTHIDRQVE